MGERNLRGNGHAAAAWVVRMASDQRTRGDAEAFEAWLAADPANAQAYAEHEQLWRGVGDLADDPAARQILGLIRPEPAVAAPRISRRWLIGGGASVAALAASGAFVALLLPGRGELFETAPGEQRTVTLADGSSVTLNTASRLRVALGNSERRLVLEAGQAYFKVAKDPSRPFRVFVGADEVRAIGTAFDVRREGDRARVTLEEGVVALYRGTVDRAPVPIMVAERKAGTSRIDRPIAVLQPGQRAVIDPTAAPQVAVVDIKREQAWRFGQIILDNEPLGDAVAEINRYGGRRIVLDDAGLAQLKISGVFHTSRPETFVDGVTAALPVKLKSEGPTSIVLEAR